MLYYLYCLLRFSQTRELWSSKAAFTIAFFSAVNHNYDLKQRTLKQRNTQNGSKSTNHRSQTLTFWTRLSKVLFPKRSGKMIDGSEKRKCQLAFELQSSHVLEKPMLVIFSVVVSFYLCCPVLLSVTWNNDSYWFFLKFVDDLHIIQTLKYEILNIVTSISDKNYVVAFNSTRSLLFSDISFRLVPIKTLAGQVPLYQYVTLTECMRTHGFLARFPSG